MVETTRNLPKHIAIIMDGNGRWAQSQNQPRLYGHQKGADVVEEITEMARELKIEYLTLYAFSSENWQRPSDEVVGLMQLLTQFLINKKQKMIANGIRLNSIGDRSKLPTAVRELLEATIQETVGGEQMMLTLALSYGSRDEWVRACKKMLHDCSENKLKIDQINEDIVNRYLDTHAMPDVDLVIRTSGECRISNFMLWQSAYAEYNFIDVPWPAFNRAHFTACLEDFSKRERRFGKTSQQILSDEMMSR